MSTIRVKRGATAPVAAYTPQAGEPVFDTTTKRLYIGDGTTVGGIPVSAVVERGSNANGEYVKYADGTMIATFARSGSQAISTASGALFYGLPAAWTFPVAFVAAPVVNCTVAASASILFSSEVNGATSTTSTQFYVLAGVSNAGVTITQRFLAIGRWF